MRPGGEESWEKGLVVVWRGGAAFDLPWTRPSSPRTETQYWQWVNLGSTTYYNISIDGHKLTVLEMDGIPVWKSSVTRELFFVQGATRREGE